MTPLYIKYIPIDEEPHGFANLFINMTPETNVVITYIQYNQYIESFHWRKTLEKLPEVIRKKCDRYVRWQDKHSCFMGKLLLIEGLLRLGMSSDMLLTDWLVDEYGKPYVDENINFNISHTEGFVVCAVSKDTIRLGIDIEKVKPINIYDFAFLFGEEVINKISISNNPHESFYRYWTATESALKADGKGFFIDMNNVDTNLNNNVVFVKNDIWYLSQVCLESGFVCYIATSSRDIQLSIYRYLDFFQI